MTSKLYSIAKSDQLYMVFYDIENDRLRKKVADCLIRHGYVRLQYSVFCGLEHPQRLPSLWHDLAQMLAAMDCPSDKLFALRIQKEELKTMKMIGELEEDIDYLTGEKHTMIL